MNTPSTPAGIARYIPFVGWLPHYQSGWLKLDVIAGLTATAVVIPQAMAYASIAGLPVEVGLYTALVPMIVYAFFGTSRQKSGCSTSGRYCTRISAGIHQCSTVQITRQIVGSISRTSSTRLWARTVTLFSYSARVGDSTYKNRPETCARMY